jgi:hypothetical protein
MTVFHVTGIRCVRARSGELSTTERLGLPVEAVRGVVSRGLTLERGLDSICARFETGS